MLCTPIQICRQNDQVLDCSDPEAAVASLATVLEVDRETLYGVITGAADLDPGEVEVDDILWERLLGAGAISPSEPYEARFFHGTRTLAPERFGTLGILRLADAIDSIWDDLHSLVPEVNRETWLRLRAAVETGGSVSDRGPAWLYREKVLRDPDAHGGVYGFLVRDVALSPPSGHHDYCAIPEIVEDIIGCAPRRWDLGARFSGASRPCLVHFRWPTDKVVYLKTALEYVWVAAHRGPFRNLTSAVDTKTWVPPESVVAIEEIGTR